ncbi:hypothetical protein ACVFI8_12000 [Agarivorans sp. MS3-6]
MFNNTIFKVSMLAAAVTMAGCANDEGTPVIPTPPADEALVIIDDGATGSFTLKVGYAPDYQKTELAKDGTYDQAGLKVSPSANGEEYVWEVETFGNGEAYFIVGSDTQMDMTDYQAGIYVFDLNVTNATASGNYAHQIVMQTSGGATDYLDRNTYYFGQDQLADLEGEGWKTITVPVSCLSADENGNFDITKVNEVFRLDIRNESVTYELGTVKLEKDATMSPEGAVEWTCG